MVVKKKGTRVTRPVYGKPSVNRAKRERRSVPRTLDDRPKTGSGPERHDGLFGPIGPRFYEFSPTAVTRADRRHHDYEHGDPEPSEHKRKMKARPPRPPSMADIDTESGYALRLADG